MAVVISRDGTRIGFDREGQGPPVVLVDGAMCYRGSGPMKPLAAQLVPHFTVYIYDRRGRGESGDTQPWSLVGRGAGSRSGRSRRTHSQAGAL